MEKAVALKPGFESALSDLALLYEIQNETGKARNIYRQLIEEHPNAWLTGCAWQTGHPGKEVRGGHRILEDVLKLDSRNREARLTLALALMEPRSPSAPSKN